MNCITHQIRLFLKTMAILISGQLKIKVTECDFDIRKVVKDNKEHILAIELYNQIEPPLRIRIYFSTFAPVMSLTRLILTQDKGHAPGPNDELYVCYGFLDRGLYQTITDYFKIKDNPLDLSSLNLILDHNGDYIISNAGEAITY